MKVNIYIDTKINDGQIFFTVDRHTKNIIAHRCKYILVHSGIESNDITTTSIEYIAHDMCRYEDYEIYLSYEDAERELDEDDN